MNEAQAFRSGFVALVGRPNSGKSTLLNRLVGEEVSIVTSLPQTTRRNLRGICSGPGHQIVFVDTPGIHDGKHALNKAISRQGMALIDEDTVDVVCYMVDLSRDFGDEEAGIAQRVAATALPVLVVFNKADVCPDADRAREEFLSRFAALSTRPSVTISATEEGARKLYLDALMPLVPEGPRYYPDEDLTDADMRFLAAEFIRKQVILATREEVPHATHVEILDYRELETGHRIEAAIHVETQGQKAIVVGKGGSIVKRIQYFAQRDIGRLAGVPVRVKCHVRVTPKWRDSKGFLSASGYLGTKPGQGE